MVNNIKDNKYIIEFHNAQVGIKPLKVEDHGKSINEISAERLNICINDFETGLRQNIIDMIKYRSDEWSEYITEYANNHIKRLQYDKKKLWNYALPLDDQKLIEKDLLMKYVHPRLVYKKQFMPTEITELIEYEEEICLQETELENKAKKYKSKNKAKYTDLMSKKSKLTSIKIQIRKNITDLKKFYGIEIGKQNSDGKTEFMSYVQTGEVLLAHENEKSKALEQQLNEIEVLNSVEKIKEKAEEILNSKQLFVFKLYYELGSTQQEIANILGVSQPAVIQQIKTINKKINLKI